MFFVATLHLSVPREYVLLEIFACESVFYLLRFRDMEGQAHMCCAAYPVRNFETFHSPRHDCANQTSLLQKCTVFPIHAHLLSRSIPVLSVMFFFSLYFFSPSNRHLDRQI